MVSKTLKKKVPAKKAKSVKAVPVVDSAKEIWFAGLGAFSVVQQEGEKLLGQGTKLFDKLVSEGARVEKESINFVDSTVDEIKHDVEKTIKDARKQANESWESLGSVFDERVSGTLERLGIPTTKDLSKLSGRVQNMTRKATSSWKEVEKVAREATDNLGKLESTTGSDKPFMASMGIYVFSTELLSELMAAPGDDFGNDIIPIALSDHRVMGHVFDGYWADIGTIRRFYEVSLELATTQAFDLNVPNQPVYTNARFLPPTELQGARISKVILAEGCIIGDAEITNSVVGIRSIIGSQVVIRDTVMMGADYYETEEQRAENKQLERPDIGVGNSSVIESAIIDKKARIGRNVQIRFLPDRPDSDSVNWLVRDGLVVVPKSAVISDDTVI